MRQCTKCGNIVKEGDKCCSRCGQPVGKEPSAASEKNIRDVSAVAPGLSWAAIALGLSGSLVGFLLLPLVGFMQGILAVAFGFSAVSQGDKNGKLGVILGVVAFILSAIVSIIDVF